MEKDEIKTEINQNIENQSHKNNNHKKGLKLEVPFQQNMMGRIIKAFRKLRNLSQESLGAMVGVKKSQISKIEKGDKNLTLGTISKLLGALSAKITFRIELQNKKEVSLVEQVIISPEDEENKLRQNFR